MTQREGELNSNHPVKNSTILYLKIFLVTKKIKKKKVTKNSSSSCVSQGLFTRQWDNWAHTNSSFYLLGTEQVAYVHKSSYKISSFFGKHFYLDSLLLKISLIKTLAFFFQLDILCQQVILTQEVHVFDTVSLTVP